jgi:gluconokinase
MLAQRLGYTFIDADDFHSAEAINHMRNGLPLTPADRDAWVNRLQAMLMHKYQEGTNCVLAFSGLRAKHRRQLMQTGFATSAFMLQGSAKLLTQRLQQRQGHFMPAVQLQNQLQTMQAIEADEQIEPVAITASSENIIETLVHKIKS